MTLDTNVVIAFLQGGDRQLKGRLLDSPPEDICLCSIVKSELLYGAAMSRDPVGSRARLAIVFDRLASLPFDDQAAELCGDIRGRLARAGHPISIQDAMIGAIAIAHDVSVATRNVREFRRIHGLRVVEW